MSLGNVKIAINIRGAYEGQAAVKQAKSDIDKLTKGTKGMSVNVTGLRSAFNKTWTETASKLNVVKQAFSAAAGAASGLFGLAKEGAAFTDQMAALQRMGVNVEERLKEAGEATKGTLADKDLLEALARFQGFGLDMEKFSESLELASKASIMTGRSVDFMVDKLVTGLVRQSPKLLDDLMIKGVQVSDINERAAESFNKLEKNVTDAEKAETLHTMALEKLRKITAGVSIANDSQAASFKRLETATANFLNTFSRGLANLLVNALEQWEYVTREIGGVTGAREAGDPAFAAQEKRLRAAPEGPERDAVMAELRKDFTAREYEKLEFSDILSATLGLDQMHKRINEQWESRRHALLVTLSKASEDYKAKLRDAQKAADRLAKGMPRMELVQVAEDDAAAPDKPTPSKARDISVEMAHLMKTRVGYMGDLQTATAQQSAELKKLIAFQEVYIANQKTLERLIAGEITGRAAQAEFDEQRLKMAQAEIDMTVALEEIRTKAHEDDMERREEARTMMAAQMGEAQAALEGFAGFASSFGDENAEAMGRVVGALAGAGGAMGDLGLKLTEMSAAGKSFSGEMGAATAQGIAQIGKLGAAAVEDKKTQAAINAAFYAAAAVVAFVSQNYVQGAGYVLAAGMYAAVAGTSTSAAGYGGTTAGIDRSRPIISDERGGGGATIVNINAPIIGGSGQEIGAVLNGYASQGEASGMGGAV